MRPGGLAAVGLLLGLVLVLAWPMELRVDEEFHVPQIERYGAGDFTTETSTAGGFHLAATGFSRLFGLDATHGGRVFVALVAFAAIATFGSLARALDPASSAMRTAQFVFLPILFPYFFFVYTDVFALLFLLLALWALQGGRFQLAGLLMGLVLFVRQSYVVWSALVGLWVALGSVAEPIRRLASRLATFALAAVGFVVFVAANRGVAVGHVEMHPDFAFHTENVLYGLLTFGVLYLPLSLARWREIAALPASWWVGVPVLSGLAFFATFRVDHPFNVDWQDFFVRNALLAWISTSTVAGLVASAFIALAVLTLRVTPLQARRHALLYPAAVLALVPQWLVEVRYLIPAFALFTLFRRPATPRAERALLATHVLLALACAFGMLRGAFFL